MPGRAIPLITNELYHVFNRGANRQPTFTNKREYQRAIESIKFYKFSHSPLSLSKYLRLEDEKQRDILQNLKTHDQHVQIFSYCLMPNHFHLLVRQAVNNGIAKFLGNFQNSYTRYFNTKHDRDGALFLDQFKAVRLETEEQMLHVSRYIHLNPYTGYVVKQFAELENYRWSSFPEYITNNSQVVDISFILNFFQKSSYKQFVFDQADYQRSLKDIKHLVFD